jgi:adenylate kinase family enzyme
MKIAIVGNSSSGKSTLAKTIASVYRLTHIDLDVVAWKKPEGCDESPIRNNISDAMLAIKTLCVASPQRWVVEGCYGDLISELIQQNNDTLLVYANAPVKQCTENALRRPWEPHKYASKAEQDKNLGMLVEWIEGYALREGPLSKAYHDALFNQFTGKKILLDGQQLSLTESERIAMVSGGCSWLKA